MTKHLIKINCLQFFLEILDEDSNEVINDVHRSGLLIATSLTRRLTPLIRCPTGDLACWCEPPGLARKFMLKGRSSLSHQIRIGYAFLVPQAIEESIQKILNRPALWQLVLTRKECIDHIVLRIAAEENASLARQLHAALLKVHAALEELIALQKAHVIIEWCGPRSLQLNPRTGKLQRVIDLRTGDAMPDEKQYMK